MGSSFSLRWFRTITLRERLSWTPGQIKCFFAKQVINNACATQAILSVLLNVDHPELTLGSTLSDFKEFVSSFDSSMKGLSLSNSEEIRSVHNSFAKQTLFEFDSKMASKDDDVYHFVSYLPLNGRLYELDGLREGPVDHGPVEPDSDWLEVVKPIIEARMAKYQAGEIHFNLMAIVQDKLMHLEKEMSRVQKDGGNPAEEARIQQLMSNESERRAKWHVENIRRRHNYIPFIIELLKSLANNGQLLPLYQKAKERSLEQIAKKEASSEL
eukprot:TRINITY_DN3790_c0_g1_i1.p1 TRINITY_DN3790_c0_g1~~TRINITY_DN3790_c0_g1_i1.p1  ORF type:complete len:270 (-),score=96.53 TRINITY_DN3790_c0_g1_i1:100-909(-)